MKVAVIGADGMLGSEFISIFINKDIEYAAYTIKDLDITNKETLGVIEQYSPNIIINCSAYTAVDKAEEDIKMAYAVNGEGVKNLAEIALKLGAKFVHFSTDYIFSGEGTRPYLEDDESAPVSVYGKSKLQGEEELRRILPFDKYLLLRTAWLYGIGGNNFVKTMIRLANEGKDIKVVDDQVGSPTFAKDLAMWTIELLDKNCNGIYHAVNSGSCNWYQFANKIFELSKLKVNYSAVNSTQFITKAKRPRYSIMNNNKLQKDLGYSIREWPEALSEYIFLTKL